MGKRYAGILTVVMYCSLLFVFSLPGFVFGADTAVEQKIKSLEQSIKSLELKATRAQDVIDIQNLQGRYEAIHNSQEWLAWMLFADRPDLRR
jgi:hypothetical protein